MTYVLTDINQPQMARWHQFGSSDERGIEQCNDSLDANAHRGHILEYASFSYGANEGEHDVDVDRGGFR